MKVATDGEVTMMTMPLEFRVLEGRLLLMAQGPSRKEARPVSGETEAA
jgi:hypothetical protein